MKNTVTLKLKLDLNSDLGRNLFAGISDALAGSEIVIKEKPVIQLVDAAASPAPAATEAKPKRVRNTAAKPEAIEAAADEAKPEAEETAADAGVETDITLADIKALIPKKVGKHREAIKAKLTEYGVPNSDQLGKEKYPEFVEFLNGLE